MNSGLIETHCRLNLSLVIVYLDVKIYNISEVTQSVACSTLKTGEFQAQARCAGLRVLRSSFISLPSFEGKASWLALQCWLHVCPCPCLK
jgi:hypothetical protein